MLTQALLKELLSYNHETGVFTWIKSPRNGWAGKVAGTVFKTDQHRTSYLRISIAKRQYFAHSLAFLYCHGFIPRCIDHIDGNGMNNAISNLREATHAKNIHNTVTKNNNSSGVKNVHWESSANKWRGTFCTTLCGGKRKVINVGLFSDINAAADAVAKKREELYGMFANHG